MDTRLLLQIVLGAIVALIVILGAIMIFTLTRDAETVIVQEIAEDTREASERRSPWADQGDAAIALVNRISVKSDVDIDVDGENLTVSEVIENEKFVKEKLKITSGEPIGWSGQWWGETKYGPSFYLVRYGFEDEAITIGPTWLVDLRTQKVVPVNVLAGVTTDPEKGMESDYYDQNHQVISAISNHRFSSRINLSGALLRYFQGEGSKGEGDQVLGWTVEHDRNELFQAYFQWMEDGENAYAHFEFDFNQRALRPVNLQANEIMRIGEDADPLDRVSIMPATYDPNVRRAANRWQGPARRQCRRPAHRDSCQALATVLDDGELIETLEWMLTTHGEAAEEFEACQEARQCGWRPAAGEEEGVFRVRFLYKLSDDEDVEPEELAWDVHLKDERIVPVDSLSELAYRAVHPRGS